MDAESVHENSDLERYDGERARRSYAEPPGFPRLPDRLAITGP
jgi:hypothetical protein